LKNSSATPPYVRHAHCHAHCVRHAHCHAHCVGHAPTPKGLPAEEEKREPPSASGTAPPSSATPPTSATPTATPPASATPTATPTASATPPRKEKPEYFLWEACKSAAVYSQIKLPFGWLGARKGLKAFYGKHVKVRHYTAKSSFRLGGWVQGKA